MKSSFKLISLASATLTLAVTLSGCSRAPVEDVYTPPGLELGGEVVAPPAPLPAATTSPQGEVPTTETVYCDIVTPLNERAITTLNKPPSSIPRTNASVNGEVVVAAEELPVETIYPNSFSYLLRLSLNDGEIVYLGSPGSLNDVKVLEKIRLDPSGNSAIFGANEEAYDHFIWGSSSGPGSAVVQEGEKIVDKYAGCF